MNTQVMPEAAITQPHLEYFPTDGGSPEQIILNAFPFTIGRNSSSELPINSSRVSRDHAVIERKGNSFQVRDLGSTNGTYVNGQPIQETMLEDGDLLVIADSEFTFVQGASATSRATVTCVMPDAGFASGPDEAGSLIREVRRLHQLVAGNCVLSLFAPVIQLDDSRVMGYEAAGESAIWLSPTATQRQLLAVDCRLVDRVRQTVRAAAAQASAQLPRESRLVLAVHPSEIGTDWLLDSLIHVKHIAPPMRGLTVEVPESAASNIPYFRDLHECLAEWDISLSYSSFSSGPGWLTEHENILPEFLKLDAALVKTVRRSKRRRQQVETLIRAAEDADIRIIADGVQNESLAELCLDLGCHYGQGSLYGPPQPATLINDSAAA